MVERNSVIRTYVEGLDFLFGGGIIPVKDGKACALLEGQAGSGKTSLALQIAFNMARETNGVSVVFSIEQRPDSLKKKIDCLNWNTKSQEQVLVLSGFSKDITRAAKSKKGCLFLLSAPADDLPTMTAAIGLDIQEMRRRLGNRQIECVVVDSLNAVEGDIQRNDFLVLNEHCASSSSLSLFVDEEHADHDRSALREYVSDIVVKLGCRDRTETEDYLERYIEIVKARNQFHYRGKHPFSIVDPARKVAHAGIPEAQGGVCIYPSMAARLSYQQSKNATYRKQGKKQTDERLPFGIESLDRLLHASGKGGLVRNSTTLVIGERGTKKTVTALHFLAAGIKEQEKGLMISLKDDEAAIRAVAQGYRVLRPYFSNESEYLQIEHVWPSYVASGNFLNRIYDWIEKSNRQIERVVFDNYAQLMLRFPLLDADPMLIPTLVDLFKMKGITSLFIDIVEEPGKAVWEYKSPVLDLADYVIATQHLAFLGSDHTVLSVRRSLEGKHCAEPAELRRDEDRIVVDIHAFDGITGVLEKDPKPAGIFMKLFYENDAESTFNKEIGRELRERYENQVSVSSFSRADSSREYARIRRYWIESPSSIVKVVSLDEYWVKYAAREGVLWEIDPSWFAESQSREWIPEDELHDFLRGAMMAATVGDKLYALPNHVDFGLFCYRKDLFADLFGVTESVPKDVCALVDLVLAKYKAIRDRKVWGFAFDMESEETLICTFLEFIFNANTTKGKVGYKFHDLRDGRAHEPLILYDHDVREAIVEALLRMRGLVKHRLMPFPCTIDDCRDSLLSRHWYSTVQFVRESWASLCESGKSLDEKRRYEKASLSVVPTAPAVRVGPQGTGHYVCSGSWYLGILKQSLRPMLGFHVIDEVTSPRKNFRRYELGAGLPTRKSFYRFRGGEDVKNLEGLKYREVADCIEGTAKCNRRLCRRETICGNDVGFYRSVRSELAEVVLEVLEGGLEKRKGMERIVSLIGRKRSKFLKENRIGDTV